jgi:Ethanolamine utilization protein EutJ (predicted chaperonin)
VWDTVNAEGKPTHGETADKFDGRDYAYTGTALPPGLTIAGKRIDANTLESTIKQEGKVVITVREVVSKDGKTLTRALKGKSPQGQYINDTEVYDKQ